MGKSYSNAKEQRKQIFLDTKNLYETNDTLKLTTKNSIAKQKVILESDLLENISIHHFTTLSMITK